MKNIMNTKLYTSKLSGNWASSTALASCMFVSATLVPSVSSAVVAVDAETEAYDEIVVTSRKRSETMGDIPMSINVVSEGLIENLGATDFTDLLGSVPSLTAYQNGPGRTRLSIRGVTNGGGNDNSTQNHETVGIYLDEIPISIGAMNPELSLFDLERVEVLRGPQGTLYGAGSMTGTIRLVSKKPNLAEFEGKVEGSLSSVAHGGENYDIKGLVNFPVVEDKFAIRASGYYNKFGGYIDNITTNEKDVNNGDSKGVKFAARLQASENLTVDFNFFHHDYSDNGRPEDLDHTPYLSRDFTSFDGYDDEMQIYNLTLNYDLGWANLTSATSHFDREVFNRRSLDNLFAVALPPGITPHELVDNTTWDVWTQEVRLASTTDSPLQWTVGAYYDKKDVLYLNTFPVPGADAIIGTPSSFFGAPDDHLFYGFDDLTVETYAFFGEVYYTFDKLTITAGGRYFNWKQDIEYYQSGLFNGEISSDTPPTGKTDGFNPKVNISYNITDDLLVYAQAARGFRYGGVNGSIPQSVCADELAEVEREGGDVRFFDPDKAWTYEAGVKGNLSDGKIYMNATYFYIDWNDTQTSRSFECGFGFTENVGKLVSQGIELEINAQVTDNLTVNLGTSYINSELAEDVPNLGALEGDSAPYVPSFSFNGSVEYTRPVSDTMDGFIWTNIQHTGERYTEFSEDPALAPNTRRMGAYTVANLRVGVKWDNYEVSLFSNNLFDSPGVVRALRRPPFDPDARIRVEPRTIGISMRANF